MPSAENSFYVGQLIPSNDFGACTGRELVEMTRRMFPLSHKREDTFLAGFSMGGFEAIRNGLKYHHAFGYIAVLSGALQVFKAPPDSPNWSLFGACSVFGDVAAAAATDKNPRAAFQQMADALHCDSNAYPKVYLACGEQDGLIAVNQRLCDFLRQGGVDVIWRQAPGDWNFWRDQIRQVLDWLPLEQAVAGVNSGDVTE